MANSNSEHSKKLRQAHAAAYNKAKLASGERKQITINGKAEHIDIINEAIAQSGASKAEALAQICRHWLKAQNDHV